MVQNIINKTNGAWVLARATGETGYGRMDTQISAMTSELHSEGYIHIGTSRLHFSIGSKHGPPEIATMMKAAEDKRISAVFVFSIRCISEDLDTAFALVDKLNALGVIVYDNEGYQYSYDWYCKQIGKRFKGGK